MLKGKNHFTSKCEFTSTNAKIPDKIMPALQVDLQHKVVLQSYR